jgi:prepilin-type N-terminal cleavage/methylation domain-containing protein
MVRALSIQVAGTRMARWRGFTVVELLVVIAIMSLLTLISVGTYSSFRKGRKIASGAEGVSTAFSTARSYAIAGNGWYTVVFQFRNPVTGAEESSYWIDEVYPDSGASAPSTSNPFPPAHLQRKRPRVTTPQLLPDGVRISDVAVNTTGTMTYTDQTASQVAVLFQPDSTSDQASVHLIETVADPAIDTNYYTIKLYRPTAKAKIFPNAVK